MDPQTLTHDLMRDYERNMQYNKEYPKDQIQQLTTKLAQLKLKLAESPQALIQLKYIFLSTYYPELAPSAGRKE